MYMLVEVLDNKVSYFKELLQNYSFVKKPNN
ncbi:MAG: hypothetical protein HW421_110 [Ignavibacteria bacterium]|nr:hypothetical protein [Ignavibacteria bacterium]